MTMRPLQPQAHVLPAFAASIWNQVADDVLVRLYPLAEQCVERTLRPDRAEREVAVLQERVCGLAEACAHQIFLEGVRIEDLDPEDVRCALALGSMRVGVRVHFCTYVACCHILTVFGLVRSNCTMPEVWPALLIRALTEDAARVAAAEHG